MRKQVEGLEHHAHRAAQRGKVAAVDVLARLDRVLIYLDGAGIRPLKEIDAPQEGAFSGARGAYQGGDRPGFNVQGHVVKDGVVAVALRDVV